MQTADRRPLYHRLQAMLRERIECGVYRPG